MSERLTQFAFSRHSFCGVQTRRSFAHALDKTTYKSTAETMVVNFTTGRYAIDWIPYVCGKLNACAAVYWAFGSPVDASIYADDVCCSRASVLSLYSFWIIDSTMTVSPFFILCSIHMFNVLQFSLGFAIYSCFIAYPSL